MRRSFVLRPARWAALLAFVFLAFPAVANAHGLSIDDDPNRPLAQYVVLRFKHMATGWDHLLFILGCVLLAPSVRSAAKLVSLFVLGHSLTLLLATLAGWNVNVTAVDRDCPQRRLRRRPWRMARREELASRRSGRVRVSGSCMGSGFPHGYRRSLFLKTAWPPEVVRLCAGVRCDGSLRRGGEGKITAAIRPATSPP